MNQKQIDILKQNLTIKDGRPVTTSLKVAESFDKRHDQVLRDIDRLECSPGFCLLNFVETVHFRPSPLNGAPIESRYFELTKNGFLFLAMGFSGKKAATLREGYILAFEQMSEELRSGMARTRDELTNHLMQVVLEAAKAGHPADFIPALVRYRRMGLTYKEIGALLDMAERTVATWGNKVLAAGVDLPKVCQRAPVSALARQSGKQQLFLFPPEAGQ